MSHVAANILDAFFYCPTTTGADYPAQAMDETWLEAELESRWLPARAQSVEQEFQELVDTWRSERGATSSITEMVLYPAYQQIIGMGAKAIPLLLRELEQRPDHWFWALNAITGVDPVNPEQRGRVREMAEQWLRWGKDQGYEW